MAASSLTARKQAADALLRAGQHREAAEAYRQCLCGAAESDDPALVASVCCNASLACARCGRATEALLYAEKALSVDSTSTKALYRKAHALRLLGNLSEASAVLAQVENALARQGKRSADTERERAALQCEVERRGLAAAKQGTQSRIW